MMHRPRKCMKSFLRGINRIEGAKESKALEDSGASFFCYANIAFLTLLYENIEKFSNMFYNISKVPFWRL